VSCQVKSLKGLSPWKTFTRWQGSWFNTKINSKLRDADHVKRNNDSGFGIYLGVYYFPWLERCLACWLRPVPRILLPKTRACTVPFTISPVAKSQIPECSFITWILNFAIENWNPFSICISSGEIYFLHRAMGHLNSFRSRKFDPVIWFKSNSGSLNWFLRG